MSAPIDEGGPAFPGQPWPDKAGVYEKAPGMSLRDWFAGQALAGICAHPDTGNAPPCEGEARVAYAFADAMLAARKRGAQS